MTSTQYCMHSSPVSARGACVEECMQMQRYSPKKIVSSHNKLGQVIQSGVWWGEYWIVCEYV